MTNEQPGGLREGQRAGLRRVSLSSPEFYSQESQVSCSFMVTLKPQALKSRNIKETRHVSYVVLKLAEREIFKTQGRKYGSLKEKHQQNCHTDTPTKCL